MTQCFLASDLHGHLDRYEKLFQAIEADRPGAVFLGGDLLPSGFGMADTPHHSGTGFISDVLCDGFGRLRERLSDQYPRIFVILGNDDPRIEESAMMADGTTGLWQYVHGRRRSYGRYHVYGCAYVPPTPFRLKDWERYDVSRYSDPGCVSPEEGARTVPLSESEARYSTIKEDLDRLIGSDPVGDAVFLFHSPPYRSKLDRAALDGKMIDHVPLDVHVGSIAIRRMIEQRQPLATLHGHVHESARLTGSWRDRIGRTHMFSAAHDGPELALVRFDLDDLDTATRDLI
jgi:Icc-related predicted phosphoesterase